MMKIYILGWLLSIVLVGCTTNPYKTDPLLQINEDTQVIVDDFMEYMRSLYKNDTWIKIHSDTKNKYISKLRYTAIRRGFKVCIDECPQNTIAFTTLIERIGEDLLEATISTSNPKSVFHRIYKIDSHQNIERFGNKTIYKVEK